MRGRRTVATQRRACVRPGLRLVATQHRACCKEDEERRKQTKHNEDHGKCASLLR